MKSILGFKISPSVIKPLISLALILIVWQLAAMYVVHNRLFLVSPTECWSRLMALIASGEIIRDLSVSGLELLYGFVLAVVVGIALGIVIAINKTFREMVDPIVIGLYSTPIVAMSPLLILWFGIDMQSKVAVVFLVSVFPIVVNTTSGIRSADNNLINVGRCFGASDFQILHQILLPSALSFIVAGLRLGIGRGLVGIVVGEMFGARDGIGYFITNAAQLFDTAGLFVGIVLLSVAGVILSYLLTKLERRLAPWRTFEFDE